MGIIIILFLLAQFLAIHPIRAVPQVLGTHTQVLVNPIDPISKKEEKILMFQKISEDKISTTEIEKLFPSPSPSVPVGTKIESGPSPAVQNSGFEQILDALNAYRQQKGVGTVQSDSKLCDFAQSRAQEQDQQGGLDSHKGFNDFMANKDNFAKLGVHGIGENSSWNYNVSAKELIETVFAGDAPHQNNQLNASWTLACAGISGKTVDIIFGRR